jgi:hypothetical protein
MGVGADFHGKRRRRLQSASARVLCETGGRAPPRWPPGSAAALNGSMLLNCPRWPSRHRPPPPWRAGRPVCIQRCAHQLKRSLVVEHAAQPVRRYGSRSFPATAAAHARHAARRMVQGAHEAASGVEIRHGNVDPRARVAYGGHITALDGAALAHVVTHDERRRAWAAVRHFSRHGGHGRAARAARPSRLEAMRRRHLRAMLLRTSLAPAAREVGTGPHRSRRGLNRKAASGPLTSTAKSSRGRIGASRGSCRGGRR